jgi:hypothetical protein
MKCASFAWLTKIGCREECWQTRMGRGCKKVNFPGSETCESVTEIVVFFYQKHAVEFVVYTY